MVEGKICPISEFLKLGTADISLHYYFRVVVGGITCANSNNPSLGPATMFLFI